MRKYTTRMLVALALLSALEVILARFIIPMPAVDMRYSLESVPIIIAGLLFGPLGGMAVGFVGDLVGSFFTGFGYNPLFAVPPVLLGLCTGLLRFLPAKKVCLWRIFVTMVPAFVLGSILWQSYWLSAIYGKNTFVWYLSSRSVQFAVISVLDTLIIRGLFASRAFEALGFWPPKASARKTA